MIPMVDKFALLIPLLVVKREKYIGGAFVFVTLNTWQNGKSCFLDNLKQQQQQPEDMNKYCCEVQQHGELFAVVGPYNVNMKL